MTPHPLINDPAYVQLVGAVVIRASNIEHMGYALHTMTTGKVRRGDEVVGWQGWDDYAVDRNRAAVRTEVVAVCRAAADAGIITAAEADGVDAWFADSYALLVRRDRVVHALWIVDERTGWLGVHLRSGTPVPTLDELAQLVDELNAFGSQDGRIDPVRVAIVHARELDGWEPTPA